MQHHCIDGENEKKGSISHERHLSTRRSQHHSLRCLTLSEVRAFIWRASDGSGLVCLAISTTLGYDRIPQLSLSSSLTSWLLIKIEHRISLCFHPVLKVLSSRKGSVHAPQTKRRLVRENRTCSVKISMIFSFIFFLFLLTYPLSWNCGMLPSSDEC